MGGSTRTRLMTRPIACENLSTFFVKPSRLHVCDHSPSARSSASKASRSAPGGGEGDYLGAERYVARDAFKATIRRKARQAPDAALDAVFDAWAKGSGCAARSQCLGSLESWRRNDGSWDLGAADRDILLGKGVVLGGFVGLAVIDFVALSALVFFAKTILFAES